MTNGNGIRKPLRDTVLRQVLSVKRHVIMRIVNGALVTIKKEIEYDLNE